ncbi:hypothetical protein V202x_40970 [Gimesia aquarii]|uniref:Uncharacterized protein n=2 Tax=Gimesia aquarii TaxID=2527964 RepID=A0A517WZK9_9PLAN|nr:hypothetical protein V202x_40970 [Gimesia aquarii]
MNGASERQFSSSAPCSARCGVLSLCKKIIDLSSFERSRIYMINPAERSSAAFVANVSFLQMAFKRGGATENDYVLNSVVIRTSMISALKIT